MQLSVKLLEAGRRYARCFKNIHAAQHAWRYRCFVREFQVHLVEFTRSKGHTCTSAPHTKNTGLSSEHNSHKPHARQALHTRLPVGLPGAGCRHARCDRTTLFVNFKGHLLENSHEASPMYIGPIPYTSARLDSEHNCHKSHVRQALHTRFKEWVESDLVEE